MMEYTTWTTLSTSELCIDGPLPLLLTVFWTSELVQWLWPKLLRKSLKEFMDFRNGTRMRKDNDKAGPSGMSRNEAFSLPESWGGRNCLLKVDIAVIRELKEAMGGDDILAFVSLSFLNMFKLHMTRWR